jgi:hypothetical protein
VFSLSLSPAVFNRILVIFQVIYTEGAVTTKEPFRVSLAVTAAAAAAPRGRRQPHDDPLLPRHALDLGPQLPLELRALLALALEALGLDGRDPEKIWLLFLFLLFS